MAWQIQLLDRSHGRSQFSCGEESLDNFLKKYARQNDKKDYSKTYVLLEEGASKICGYYTVCSGSVSFKSFPDDIKFPRYPIPTGHIARLAIDKSLQAQGLGGLLLADAFKRFTAVSQVIGIYAITVQALHKKAAKYYSQFGFIPFKDDSLHLFIPVKTILNLC